MLPFEPGARGQSEGRQGGAVQIRGKQAGSLKLGGPPCRQRECSYWQAQPMARGGPPTSAGIHLPPHGAFRVTFAK